MQISDAKVIRRTLKRRNVNMNSLLLGDNVIKKEAFALQFLHLWSLKQ